MGHFHRGSSAGAEDERTKVFLLLGPERERERYTLKSNLAIETLSQSVSRAIKGGTLTRSWLLANASAAAAADPPVYAPLTRKYLARSPKVTEKVVMLRRTTAGHVRVRRPSASVRPSICRRRRRRRRPIDPVHSSATTRTIFAALGVPYTCAIFTVIAHLFVHFMPHVSDDSIIVKGDALS